MPALTTWWIVDVATLCSILALHVWARHFASAVRRLEVARARPVSWPNRHSNA